MRREEVAEEGSGRWREEVSGGGGGTRWRDEVAVGGWTKW